MSERVAILEAIKTNKLVDNQHTGSENFPTQNEAAIQAGLGNERTARDAKKAVNEGVPGLVEKTDAGDVSISAAGDIATLPEDTQEQT